MSVADVLEVLVAFDSVLAAVFGVALAVYLVNTVISWFSKLEDVG